MNPWLDKDGNEISAAVAERLLADPAHRYVGRTRVTSHSNDRADLVVTTVWRGRNDPVGYGPPGLFETRILSDNYFPIGLYGRRYATRPEADAGHDEVVGWVAGAIADEVVTQLVQ